MNQQQQIENEESAALKRLSVQVKSLLQIENLKEKKSQTQKMEEENRKINCEFSLSPSRISELSRLADLRKSFIEDFSFVCDSEVHNFKKQCADMREYL